MGETLIERLTPGHLVDAIPEDTAAIKEAVLADVEQATSEEQPDPQVELREQREYTFPFSWTDGRGKVWKGGFTNKILSIAERGLVGVMRARLAGGMPSTAIDEVTAEVNLYVAHMTFSLVKAPDWAENLRKLDDIRLLQAIYAEVARHEDTFFGHTVVAAEG